MKPEVKIIEQPAERSFRFRYISEGRLKGSIEGANTKSTSKTYPKIEISNFTGEAVIVISCVSDTKPYRPHPHKLTSERGGCYQHRVTISGSKIIEYKDINILFTKKNDIVASLTERKETNIDPYEKGWDHMLSPQSINLHAVRLCFQVIFLNKDRTPAAKCTMVTNSIKDKKKSEPPKIHEISATTSCISGGERIMLFCDKVQKDDIWIVFYDESSDWKHELTTMKVHHQYGISFRTPPYKEIDMFERKTVFMKLYRPSDQESSKPISFEYYTRSEQSTQLRHKAPPKRHKNFPEESKLKPTECAKPLNPQHDQNFDPKLTSFLFKVIENGAKDEPHNGTTKGEKENNRPKPTISEILSCPATNAYRNSGNNVPGDYLQNPQQQQHQQQHYSVYNGMYRDPMSLTNHHMMNIQQTCQPNANNGYQSNHINYYQNTNNNFGDLYPINSPMPGYTPKHNYNHIPDAQPISSHTNHGYQMNNNYLPGMNADLGPDIGNPYTSQSNVPVYNGAEEFDPKPIPNTSLTRILEDIQDMSTLSTSLGKMDLQDINEINNLR